jgi:hypothetical protein
VSRGSATLLALLFFGALVVATTAKGGVDPQHHQPRRVVGYGQIKFEGLGPEAWAHRARIWHKAYLKERRVQMTSPTVTEAIDIACATYGWCSTLWRKASCETGGTFNKFSRNLSSGAAGLFQFLPSTWRSTPYASMSIWDPVANALAAGWMHVHGRGGEWVCQ